jgi:ATP-dependent RNA helicase RhlE
MSFENLNIIEPILRALKTEGYTKPTPIQEQSIPIVLDRKDLLGCAQTGTGKTAAFAIPILQLLKAEQDETPLDYNAKKEAKKTVRALILTPTRELALQIGASFSAYGKHTGVRFTVIYGGVPQGAQTEALKRGVDVLVATPGRLLDLMEQKFIKLNTIKMFVLDEADRMLDMGFIHDVNRVIAALPAKRQTLFFSATMPAEIQKLANTILRNPEKVAVTPVSSTVDTVSQSVYYVDKSNKKHLLIHLLKDDAIRSALIFTRTKHGADRVAKDLSRSGVHAEAIHGNKSQNQRQRALNNFKERKTRVLVATDIAARGIDIDELSHVINFDLPNIPETYVHRIGRTGRAGLSGTSLSFCDAEEKEYLRDIHKLTMKQIPVVDNHPFPMVNGAVQKTEAPKQQRQQRKKSFKKPQHTNAHVSKPSHGSHSSKSSPASNHSHAEKSTHAAKPAHASKHPQSGKPAPASKHPHRGKSSHGSKSSHSPKRSHASDEQNTQLSRPKQSHTAQARRINQNKYY